MFKSRSWYVKHFPGYGYLILAGFMCLAACNTKQADTHSRRIDYIREIPGINDTIPVKAAQKGEVLIAYSDCYTCHKTGKRSVGPAFKDIARRYPVQDVYMNMLAQKIISGGSGSWGRAVMSPHPGVSFDDAKLMAGYILSLKE